MPAPALCPHLHTAAAAAAPTALGSSRVRRIWRAGLVQWAGRLKTSALVALGAACIVAGVLHPNTAAAQGWGQPQYMQPAAVAPDIASYVRQWLPQTLEQQPPIFPNAPPLRLEAEVGRLDARLQLAPCQHIEPYVPTGSRLWGRTRVGVRCVAGPTPWNVFIPVTVRAFGPAWVLVGNVNAGEMLHAAHASLSEVDWAEQPSPIVAEPQQWQGFHAAHPLRAGVALRQSMLKAPTVFKAGASVKVIVEGGGFAVTGSGRAMNDGAVGAQVRVRMESGRFVTGVVNEVGDVLVRQ